MTNKSFVLDLLDQPEVIDASADTGWIDRVRAEGRLVSHRHSAIALAAAAIEAYQDEEEVSRQRLLSTAHGGRPQVQHETGRPLDLKLRGVGYRVSVARIGQQRFRVGISGGGDVHPADVEIERFDAHSGQIVVNGRRFRLVSATHGPIHLVEVDGVTHRISRDEGGVVRSPAPALVVATPVSVGDEVESGAPILVLESMKMETVLRAPFRARVRECPVSVGSQVETGAPLMRLEPLADEGADERGRRRRRDRRDRPARRAGGRVRRPSGSSAACRTCAACCSASTSTRTTASACCPATWPRGPSSGGRPLAERAGPADRVRRPVRAEPQQAGRRARRRAGQPGAQPARVLPQLPAEPRRRARRARRRLPGPADAGAAATTASPSLDRTPELEAAVFRIFLAQQRMSADVAIVSELLRQWLTGAPPLESLSERAGLTLEHLVEATQVRFPVGDRPGPRRGVPLVRPAAAAPQPRQGLRRGARRPALPRPQPGRAGPRGADPGHGRQRRAAGPADRPADRAARPRPRAAAGGADPPLLRQPRAVRGHRRARSRAAGSSPPSTPVRAAGRAWSPPPSTSARCPTPSAPSAQFAADVAEHARWSPTSTSRGRTSPTPTRWRRGSASCSPQQPLPAGVRRITTTVAGTSRRRDAPPLHLPAATAPASPRTG